MAGLPSSSMTGGTSLSIVAYMGEGGIRVYVVGVCGFVVCMGRGGVGGRINGKVR